MENPERTARYHAQRQAAQNELGAQMQALPAGPIVLELGCGHGHHLCALAQRYQDRAWHFCGVDKNAERIERAGKKSARHKLPIVWLAARVEDVLAAWPDHCQLEELWVLFPDPWPKARHHKHRFVSASLIAWLEAHLASYGRFYFRSDHAGYAQEVRALLEGRKGWRLDVSAWPEGLPVTVFQGHHPVYHSLVAQWVK